VTADLQNSALDQKAQRFGTQDSSPTQSRIIPLLALVFVSRVIFAFIIAQVSGPSGFFSPDSYGYLELARSLLQGSFSLGGVAEIFRTPGYPLLLVPAVGFGHPVVIGLFENFLLATGSAWLIWRIAKDLFPGSNAATWAVLLYCVEPVSVVHSERLLSETLFCTQFVLFVWLLIRSLDKPGFMRTLVAAVALAIATYTRPVTLYLGFALIPMLLLFVGSWPAVQRAKSAILFVLMFSVLLLPWVIRNRRLADYASFSCTANWNLYFFSAAAIEAKLEHRNFMDVSREWGNIPDPEAYFRVHPEQRAWAEGAIARFWGTEAKRILSQHPLLYSGIHLQGCAVVLFDPEVTEILKPLRLYSKNGADLMNRTLNQGMLRSTVWLFREYPIVTFLFPVLLLQMLFYYGFAIKGMLWLPPRIRWLFVLFIAYVVLVSAFPAATGRYRAPIMPLVCIAAGVAIAQWRASDRPLPAASQP
jgi:4-amino-4-deoxy-L-arabinose transferase-like glycosyltransferase